MKLTKKIVSLFLSIILLSSALVLVNPTKETANAAEVPVQLYYANTNYSGSYYHTISGYIAIKNIAYAKIVNVKYNKGNGTWGTISASYLKNNTSDGYEVWKFDSNNIEYFTGATEFYIEYTVNGQTYTDKNGGKNYTVRQTGTSFYGDDGYTFGKQQVVVTSITKGNRIYNAETANVNVRVKGVSTTNTTQKVTYSENNYPWYTSSVSTKTQTYSDGSNGYIINLPLINGYYTPAYLKLAACYTVNGVANWDNNFGSNYSATIQ